jgi:hypothetical protein
MFYTRRVPYRQAGTNHENNVHPLPRSGEEVACKLLPDYFNELRYGPCSVRYAIF